VATDSAFIFLACPRKMKQKERHFNKITATRSLRFSLKMARIKTRPSASNTDSLNPFLIAMLSNFEEGGNSADV